MSAILEIENLCLTIGGAKIVDDISLHITPNEVMGIIGPNGAGKTSFFNLVSGIRPVTSGKITLKGIDITKMAPHQRAKVGIARTFQTSSVFGNLSLLENSRIAAHAALENSMNLTRSAYSYKEAVALAHHSLEQVGLESKAQQIAGSLSHGDKRRLEIALVLASKAQLVLLDEPMAGMSVEHIPELVEIIRSLTTVHKKTVLIVEHHMEVILGLADRIAVLNYGKLLICDTPEAVMNNKQVQSAYIGTEL